jgi:Holliday junction resolvase RusA-like endonuclease
MKQRRIKKTDDTQEKYRGNVRGDMIKFEVKGEIPSQKNVLRFARGRAFYANDEIKRYKAAFARQVPVKFKREIGGLVRVSVMLYLKDMRKDAHNCLSVIFDSLEFAKIIKNDRQVIGGIWGSLIDKGNPRVVIQVDEL